MREVLLTDLGSVTFRGRDQAPGGAADPAPLGDGGNLTIDRVTEVQLHPHALEGWRGAHSVVWIKNVARCRVDGAALAATTSMRRLLLENITSLVLAKGALQASVGELVLRNVTVAECPRGAIGGRVERLRLDSSTLRTVRAGCLRVRPGTRLLSLSHSRLGRVSTDAISGRADDVTVRHCKIDAVATGGVRLNTTRLSLLEADVAELRPDALQVDAAQSVSLHALRISGRLHTGALRGLRVVGAQGSSLNITGLRVARAEPGSLQFAPGTAVHVRELEVDIHKECSEEWGGAHTHSVYVPSAWQSAAPLDGCQSRLEDFFRPLFECDFQAALNETQSDSGTDGQQLTCARKEDDLLD